MPNYIFNKKNYELNLNKYLDLENKEKVVLNLWHIETFEGGTNSRSKYIEQQAIKFNKENQNCFILVTKMTEEQLVLNLKQNLIPDIFSFGVGVGYLISGYLTQLDFNNNIREDLIDYGKLNNNIYAYPYILSGYCLITNKSFFNTSQENYDKTFSSKKINKTEVKGLSITTSSYLNSSEVLLKQKLTNINKNNILQFSSTYNAYANFVSKKSVSLLGTARDLARCKNRESNGNLFSCNYTYLSGYTDLVQYVGVNKNLTKIKTDYAKLFSKFLTLYNSQKRLSNYGLFSTTNKNIYLTGYMKDFELTLNKKITSVNVFSSYDQINKNNIVSFNKLFF